MEKGELNLTQKTSQGVFWKGISQIITQGVRFLILLLLARLLKPDDFGLLAMVAVFTNFFSLTSDLGLNAAIIQKKELNKEELSSIFWLILLLGIFWSVILFALSPLVAKFYSRPELLSITAVLGISFFLSSFGSVPVALLSKRMNFKVLAFTEIGAVIISGSIAIILAFGGFGVWALVAQSLSYSFFRSLFNFLACPLRPVMLLKISKIKKMIYFGSNVVGLNFINYFSRNIDSLIIGKFIGSVALGFYNLAYRIMLFPIRQLSGAIGGVMFPALSLVQYDHQKVGQAYLRAIRMIATITFPAMFGLWVIAPEFVRIVLGEKWIPILYILRIFCWVGAFQSIATTVGWIYLSQGRADLQLKVGIFIVSVYIIAFIVGLRWGINGVATCYGLSMFIIAYPAFKIPFSLINLKIVSLIKIIILPLYTSTIMMGIVLIFKKVILKPYGSVSLIMMISEISIGVSSYILLTILFNKPAIKEIKIFYNSLLGK